MSSEMKTNDWLPNAAQFRLFVYKMQQHDLFYNLDHVTTYHKDFVSSTGYRSMHESCTNCVFLCMTSTAADNWHTLKTLSQHAVQPHIDLICVQLRPPTASSHDSLPSSENVLSPTPVQMRGTIFPMN